MTQLGQYTLLDKIGSGVLATVYRALDTASGQTVALKVLQLDLLDDVTSGDMDARLQSEFKAVSRLTHPGIARVFDLRRDGNTALIATELVDGPAVTSFAATQGGFDVSQTVTAIVQILEALAFAHYQSVVHQDLKPSNVLVSRGTRTKITDFGMANLGARNRTETGLLVGTMEYMAPEQFLGRPIDERCDIHAVGTIFYELLTGNSPFADARGFAMPKVVDVTPPPPSQVKSGLTPAFDRVVARALAKSPADRFATAWKFRDELCAAYSALMGRAPPDTLAPVAQAPDQPTPSAAHTTSIRRRPVSWSPDKPASDERGVRTAVPDVAQSDEGGKAPALQSAGAPSSSDLLEARPAAPRPAAAPSPDLTAKPSARDPVPRPVESPRPPLASKGQPSPLPVAGLHGSRVTEPANDNPPPARTEYVRAPSASARVAPAANGSSMAVPSPLRGAPPPARGPDPDFAPAPPVDDLRDRTPASVPPRVQPPALGQDPPRPAAAGPPPMPPEVVAPVAPVAPEVRRTPPGIGSTPAAGPMPGPVPRRAAAPIIPTRSHPLTNASIALGERVLARFVGPIAIVHSRRAAKDAGDERGYFELLAAHLSDPKERTQFFHDIRKRPA